MSEESGVWADVFQADGTFIARLGTELVWSEEELAALAFTVARFNPMMAEHHLSEAVRAGAIAGFAQAVVTDHLRRKCKCASS